MGCLYLEIEGQSCLVGSVDQGLMESIQIDLCWTAGPPKSQKIHFRHIFHISTLPGIFSKYPPKESLQIFCPNFRLSIVVGLTAIIRGSFFF